MEYYTSCEEDVPASEAQEIYDPIAREVLGYHCESCDEHAGEQAQEDLHG